jgi:CheY-like chemotaxis protein
MVLTSAIASTRSRASDRRVLVVDDNQDIRELILFILRDAGLTAISAANGDQAIALLELHPVDLVLLDVMMPGKNGLQILSEIRQSPHPATAALPVILISAKSQTTDVDRGLALGANSYIIKPFTADALLKVISTELDLEQAAQV